MSLIGRIIEGAGVARHKSAISQFLAKVFGINLTSQQLDGFSSLISAGYREGLSIEDIGLRIATAMYAHSCQGDATQRAFADRLYLKLPFVIGTSAAMGAITSEAANEFQSVVSQFTKERLLRSD